MAKIYLKNRGRMPDIPEKFKDLYDKDKMLVLLKGKKLTKKELIEKCKENRTFGDYLFSDSTYYTWIREWIKSGLIRIEGEGKSAFLSLTQDGEWVTDAESKDGFLERLGNLGAL